ncbi:hypothetical protein ACWGJ2_19805 [Streptomyces sp. NPDC054796]
MSTREEHALTDQHATAPDQAVAPSRPRPATDTPDDADQVARPRQPASPPGRGEGLVAAGRWWDAVQMPSYLGERVLTRLGQRSGPVIRDPYAHYLHWLVVPGSAEPWRLPGSSLVRVLGRGCWVMVPPGGCTRSPGPHWTRPRADGPQLTPAGPLLAALTATVADELAAAPETHPAVFGQDEAPAVLGLLRAALPDLIDAVVVRAAQLPVGDAHRQLATTRQDIAERSLRLADASDCGVGGAPSLLARQLAHHHRALRDSLSALPARSLPVQPPEAVVPSLPRGPETVGTDAVGEVLLDHGHVRKAAVASSHDGPLAPAKG